MAWFDRDASGQLWKMVINADGSITPTEVGGSTATPGSNYNAVHVTSGAKLIKRAMRLIGATDPGEELSAAELQDGQEALNAMLDAWNTEKLMAHAAVTIQHTLTVGLNAYTIGEGGDIDTARPPRIELARLESDGIAYPLDAVTVEKWAEIPPQNESGMPSRIYYDAANPVGNIAFDAIPDKAYTLTLYVRTLLSQITEVKTLVALPPGYADAIAYNLAVRLAPEFGKSVSAEVAQTAMSTKANVKRANLRPIEMKCDAALLSPSGFDIRRGY